MKYVNTVLWESHGFRLMRVSEEVESGEERTLWAYELESSAEQLAPAQLTGAVWGILSSLVADGYRYWGSAPTVDCCRACGGSGLEDAKPPGGHLVDGTSPDELRIKSLISAIIALLGALRSVATVQGVQGVEHGDGPQPCWCTSAHLLHPTDEPWSHSDRCQVVRTVISAIDPQAGRVA